MDQGYIYHYPFHMDQLKCISWSIVWVIYLIWIYNLILHVHFSRKKTYSVQNGNFWFESYFIPNLYNCFCFCFSFSSKKKKKEQSQNQNNQNFIVFLCVWFLSCSYCWCRSCSCGGCIHRIFVYATLVLKVVLYQYLLFM